MWISLNVTGYVEISMDPFSKEILTQSQCYRVHGNFHGPFRLRICEFVSMLQDTWKFPWTFSVKNLWISLSVAGYMEILYGPFLTLSVKHLKFSTIWSQNNVFVFLKDIYLFLRCVCTSEYKRLRHCRDICHVQVEK